MSTGLFSDEEETYNLDEENVKYKLKLDTPSEPALSIPTDTDDVVTQNDGDGDFAADDDEESDKPFDDEGFDAGIDVDEEIDPEKFIQKLAGKIGTSLRKYNDERDEPDYELEKYVINSVISATNTSEMSEDDQKDIIKKIKSSSNKSSDDENSADEDTNDEISDDVIPDTNSDDESQIEEMMYGDDLELYVESSKPMKMVTKVDISEDLKYHIDNSISLSESIFRYGSDKYIQILSEIKKLYKNGHIVVNTNDAHILEDFTDDKIKVNGEIKLLEFIEESNDGSLNESDKFKGKSSGSPSRDSSGGKAYKVYVAGCSTKTETNPRGIKLIRFGSGGLKAKLSDSDAKKRYDSRHGCSDGRHNDKCKAGYWSCRLPRYSKKLGLSGGGKWW